MKKKQIRAAKATGLNKISSKQFSDLNFEKPEQKKLS
jgi:hypothetical protein